MRVLVCGGRDFTDRDLLFLTLDELKKLAPIDCIIHGAAPGADLLAEEWAKVRQVDYQGYPAKWGSHGRSAGPIRNTRMLIDGQPKLVIAFPGGRGTEDMIMQAKEAKVEVFRAR